MYYLEQFSRVVDEPFRNMSGKGVKRASPGADEEKNPLGDVELSDEDAKKLGDIQRSLQRVEIALGESTLPSCPAQEQFC